jgi:ATP-dependent protease ClpP protease subunit
METNSIPEVVAAGLVTPGIRIYGALDDVAVTAFLGQLGGNDPNSGPLLIELDSTGGDADAGRRIAEEIRLAQEFAGLEVWCLGKTRVASAAVTIMAAVPPQRRWLTRDTTLLIHGRRMTRDVHLDGPLDGCRRMLAEIISDIDQGLRCEEDGFALLVKSAPLSVSQVRDKAYDGWYLTASEALNLGLVAGVV